MYSWEYALIFWPPAIYCLGIALLHLSGKTFVVDGRVDKCWLALALFGPILAGPMKLLPLQGVLGFWGSVSQHGLPLDLMLVILMAFLLLTLLLRLAKRTTERSILYNITADRLQPVLREVATRLDAGCRIAGNSFFLPALRIQFFVRDASGGHTIQLVATSRNQETEAWDRMNQELRTALREVAPARSLIGLPLLLGAVFLLACGIVALI